MTTVTITKVSGCAGGDHATLTVAVNGTIRGTYQVEVPRIIGALADEDVEAMLLGLCRAYKIGRTKAQVNAAFEAGVVITL